MDFIGISVAQSEIMCVLTQIAFSNRPSHLDRATAQDIGIFIILIILTKNWLNTNSASGVYTAIAPKLYGME